MTKSNSWDTAARARASNRWTKASADWNTAMTDALLDAAALEPVSRVLDLAAGSGDPALSIAQRLSGGRVIALDSSRAGLLLANTHVEDAVHSGRRTRYPTRVKLCGPHHMPLRHHVLYRYRTGHVRNAARAQAWRTRCSAGLGTV